MTHCKHPLCSTLLGITFLLNLVRAVSTADDPPPTEPTRKAGQERSDNGLALKLAWVPSGKFKMGSPTTEKDRDDDEGPVDVTLTKGFWLGKYELTKSQWESVMGTTPWKGQSDVKEGNEYPATHMSWDDAMTFCEKLTKQEQSAGRLPMGWEYTLPTEAQWEFACRAGTTTRFGFGDDDSQLGDYAWFEMNAENAQEEFAHAVGQKRANAWGLHDMHGNVSEWCLDIKAEKLGGGTNPVVRTKGLNQVNRGGGWTDTAAYCKSAFRRGASPVFRGPNLGFRLALSPSAE